MQLSMSELKQQVPITFIGRFRDAGLKYQHAQKHFAALISLINELLGKRWWRPEKITGGRHDGSNKNIERAHGRMEFGPRRPCAQPPQLPRLCDVRCRGGRGPGG
ncbi:hypothetical protein EMEDMD4_940037 [Sinorhizobium medicae]|uniref:Uncharacterized protein n=1 Tax=Sinorhizobium medicae TaxID=110321 RepID=A0A508XCA7_9HYPH|nr:hypothetical protein EMEDMD4_940037 [Sinorhizobium medicae]